MTYKLAFLFLFFQVSLVAQSPHDNLTDTQESRVAKATEFGIPSSPAFNMLNESTPSRIERYASLRDIKVDWSLTNGQQGYNISPGLALEVQPVWLLFFDRAAAAKYRAATPLTRTLSTLSFSVGTNASNDKNWLAWAVKINLYRQHDPLDDDDFLRLLEETCEDSKDTFYIKIKELEMRQIRINRRDPNFSEKYKALSDSIMELEFGIQELDRAQSQKLADARDAYIQKHWNASFLDVAFGRLFTYQQAIDTIFQAFDTPGNPVQTDTATLLHNTLRLTKKGYGVWLSGGVGIGHNGMISGMIRYGKKPSRLTAEIGEVFSVGMNLRYGSPRYSLFIEGFLDRSLAPLAQEPGTKVEQKLYTLTLGGDWRISRNVVINFGIRQIKDFDNEAYLLQPLMNVNCLMR